MRLELPAAAIAAADPADVAPESRTITGQAVVWDQFSTAAVGGRFAVARDALTWPADLRRVKLLRAHDRERPVGYVAACEPTDTGLRMRFRVARTPDGDAALLEAAEGIRDGLSVELDDVEQDAAGLITSARVVAVGLVALPAYADARVADVAASQPERTAMPPDTASPTLDAPPAPVPPDAVGAAAAAPANAAATAPAVAASAPLNPTPRATVRAVSPGSLHHAASVLAAYSANSQDPAVAAALADITYTALDAASQPAWLGELWTGVRFRRRISPRMAQQPLTSYRYIGWKFGTKPTGGPYAGDKAEIPSGPVTVQAVPLTAKRWAGGNDIDRAVIDFNDTEFLDAYSREMADDYASDTDTDAFNELLAAATAVGAATLSEALVAGALKVGESGLTVDNVLISEDQLIALAGVTNANSTPIVSAGIGGLDMSGLLDLTYPGLPANTVLMWARAAATYRELPGSPLRFDALELARAGVDRAFFGYYRTFVNKPGGVVAVTITPGP